MPMKDCSCNERQMIIGDAEFYFCQGAGSIADARARGWQKYCAVEELGIATETEVKSKSIACRGQKRKVKSINRMMGLKYKLTLAELGPRQLALVYFGDANYNFGNEQPNNIQAALVAVAGTPFNFDVTAGGTQYELGRWLALRNAAGKEVTDLTALTLTGGQAHYGVAHNSTALVEGVDYSVDMKTGLVAFAYAIDEDTITPTITAKAITQSSDEYLARIRVMSQATHQGMARLYVWDDDAKSNLALRHLDFHAQVTVSSAPTFKDDFATVEIEVEVLDIVPSDIYCRPDVDVFENVIY